MIFRIILTIFLFISAHVWAQETKPKEPLEITAKKSLEWHRDAKLYIARENAIAKQGATELHGDTLTAAYTEGETSEGLNISRIEAEGNVLVVSDGSSATGDRGFYDIKTGYSELTGNNLMLQTKTDTVTAEDKLTYDSKTREMAALGNARAVRNDDVITSDKLLGRFISDAATGDTKLKELEAVGHVVIKTPSDTLYGDRGIYDAGSNIAKIFGNVKIERGPNVITGARGEVDLNTNVSRIFGSGDAASTPSSGGHDGRVRGVFYPD